MSNQIKTTEYKVFDGDYIDEEYGELINDIQKEIGASFGAHKEIAVSLDDGSILIEFSNDEGDRWEDSVCYPAPAGWSMDRLQKMFAGYAVYLETDEF